MHPRSHFHTLKRLSWKTTLIVGIVLLSLLLLGVAKATDSISSPIVNSKAYPLYPQVNYGTGPQAEIIKRGEYLAKAGDCLACHTDTQHHGIPFAGGLGIKTPFGTFYTPNITADKKTGIGNWSDENFLRAMQQGIRPDGSYYYPVFPYTYFTKIHKDDLLAIKAYLFALQPIHQPPSPNYIPFPFNWRFLQLGWRILFFHPGEFQNDSKQSPQWNNGAYLVQGLGHCGMCHTPINFLGAPQEKYFLTGNFVNGYFAPDISGVGLQGDTVNQVIAVFTQDYMLKNAGTVQGPMAEVNHDSLKYLTTADLNSIAIYLQTVISKEPKTSSGPITPATGKKIYDAHCAVCHTTGAAGAPKLGNNDDWSQRIKQGMPVLLQHALNGYNSMPPKGTCASCSDDEIKAAIQYIIIESQPGAKPTSTVTTMTIPAKPTLADGKKIYEQHCALCHAQGLQGAPKLGDENAWAPLINQNMDVLFSHTITGYNGMPARGTCNTCTDAELDAAVIYMVQKSKTGGNYQLWESLKAKEKELALSLWSKLEDEE